MDIRLIHNINDDRTGIIRSDVHEIGSYQKTASKSESGIIIFYLDDYYLENHDLIIADLFGHCDVAIFPIYIHHQKLYKFFEGIDSITLNLDEKLISFNAKTLLSPNIDNIGVSGIHVYLHYFFSKLAENSAIEIQTELNYDALEDMETYFRSLTGTHSIPEIVIGLSFPEVTSFNKIKRTFVEAFNIAHNNASYQLSLFLEQESFIRSIEFKPEDYQAGLGIINYFGTYLNEQYPDEKAHIKIEQLDNKVKMIINTEGGKTETIEKAFNEYGLIMSGSVSASETVSNPILIAKLETKIELLNVELNSERRLNNLQATTINSFMEMFRISHSSAKNYQFVLSNTNSTSISISIQNEIVSTIKSIKELKEALPVDAYIQTELDEIEKSLQTIKGERDPGLIRKSSALSKIKGFINKVNEGQDVALKGINTIEKGGELLQKVVRGLNSLVDVVNNLPI